MLLAVPGSNQFTFFRVLGPGRRIARLLMLRLAFLRAAVDTAVPRTDLFRGLRSEFEYGGPRRAHREERGEDRLPSLAAQLVSFGVDPESELR